MPFIGTQPDVGGYSVLDALTASATASYTLQLNSANFVPNTANQLLVSLNGVIQKPGSSFTVSGSTLTFSSALTSSDSIDFIIAMGEPLLVGVPSDGTVTGNKLASNIGISTTGNIATTGSGTLSVAGTSTLTGNTTVAGTLTNTGLITASSGIAIGGTGAVNTLDDYEEGTYTPVLTGNTTGSGTTIPLSSNYNVLSYTKIGRQVTVNGKVETSGSHSASGYLKCSLPFVVADLDKVSGSGAGNVFFYRTGAGLHTNPTAIPSENSSVVLFYQSTGGGDVSTINAQDMDSAIEFFITVIYFTT